MRALAALIFALLFGCTTTPADKAQEAALSDIGTTGIGLALGAAEMNPLGLLTMPLKYGLLEYAKTLPDGERQEVQLDMAAVWNGFSANNVCVVLVILSGGAAALGCLAVGAGVAFHQWNASTNEREFWRLCAEETRTNPAMRCEFKNEE